MRLRTSSQQQQKKSLSTELEVKEEPNDEQQDMSPGKLPVCYCDGERKLGDLEVCCAGCKRWFHQACFRNLKNFGGLPFMVSYAFHCQNCSPESREKWSLRSTSFSSMAVMALANMTMEYRIKQTGSAELKEPLATDKPNPYFNLNDEIVTYMHDNWEYLSTAARRQKQTWRQTIQKILQKETELFEQDPCDENSFALRERDLFRIGPLHESVVKLFKRNRDAVEREANALQIGDQQLLDSLVDEGPKTRGASKRKAAAISAVVASGSGSESSPKPGGGGGSAQKKAKMAAEFATVQIEGQPVDFPFNREGYRYYLVEKDPNIENRERFDTDEVNNIRAVHIPSHIYRIVIHPNVHLSPNDRANQLYLEGENCLTVTGYEGYAMVRASHSVSHGSWYFEMEFLKQPGDSHIRVGWAQSYAVHQACVGYSKFTYGWRSKKGTIFHDGRGKHYSKRGFGQGDTLGCLIDLPSIEEAKGEGIHWSDILPASKKDCDLIKFKQTCFFEEKEESQQHALQRLKPLKNSKIEFFLNGQSCGTAFEDIYAGHYFPAVSLYQSARVRMNFGPEFRFMPQCVSEGHTQPMSARPEQMGLEQSLADTLYMVSNEDELERRNAEYFDAISTKDNAPQ